MKLVRIISLAILLSTVEVIGLGVSCPQVSFAQVVRDYAGEFLQLGVGARSLALGGAGAAISDDATAGYWNPASLNSLPFPMVTAMHETRFNGTVQYNYGAFAFPLDSHSTAAISLLHIGISDIKDTRNALVDINHNGTLDPDEYLDYAKVSSFGNYDWVAILSYGKDIDTMFSYGVNAKVVYRRLDLQTTGTGLGFDIAARYRATSQLILAAVAQDITTTLLSYTTGTKELVSPTLKLGGAYRIDLTANGYHRLVPTADLDLRFEDRGDISQIHLGPLSADLHGGIEYQLGTVFALRGGWSDLNAWSVGAGLAFAKLHVDYAFLAMNGQDQLGNTHRISLSFSLEQPKWKRS